MYLYCSFLCSDWLKIVPGNARLSHESKTQTEKVFGLIRCQLSCSVFSESEHSLGKPICHRTDHRLKLKYEVTVFCLLEWQKNSRLVSKCSLMCVFDRLLPALVIS